MVDKDQEVAKFVKEKRIWKLALDPEFPEEYYKDLKKQYFSGVLKNKVIARDQDIAKAVLDCLFKMHYIKDSSRVLTEGIYLLCIYSTVWRR